MTKVTGKKYILWDFDGTIINSEPAHFKAFNDTVSALSGEGHEVGWDQYKKIVGNNYSLFSKVMQPLVPCNMETDEFKTLLNENLFRILDEDCPPVDGVIPAIVMLYERGYEMAVASSSEKRFVTKYLAKLGLMDYFDFIVSGDMIQNSKPAPDIYLKAVEEFGTTADRCIVVEDAKNGVAAGKAANIYTIGYQNPDSGEQDLSSADVVLQQMIELVDVLA